jgi:antitoxin YefM
MDAMTTQEASHNLHSLIDRIIDNVEPTILCKDRGNKAILISLDEFSACQETLSLLSNSFNTKHLLDSIQSAKVGQTIEKALIEE